MSSSHSTIFYSPTHGRLTFEQVYSDIISYIDQVPDADYKIIVGTDSQLAEETCFVSAIIVHRKGKGARYYYTRERERFSKSLRQRIFYEASKSLGLAGELARRLSQNGHSDLNVEIHLDIGPNGQTKDLIREVVGMIAGSGFDAMIKPDSYGASKVADKYTK